MDDRDLPCQSAPRQGIFFCPNGLLSQKEPFTVCAAGSPGPVGHLRMPPSNSANTSQHTLSPQAGLLRQLISPSTTWVLIVSGGQENANKASSGHPHSPDGAGGPSSRPRRAGPGLCQSCRTWAGGTVPKRSPCEQWTEFCPLEPVAFLQQLPANTLKAKDSRPEHRTSWRPSVSSHMFQVVLHSP